MVGEVVCTIVEQQIRRDDFGTEKNWRTYSKALSAKISKVGLDWRVELRMKWRVAIE